MLTVVGLVFSFGGLAMSLYAWRMQKKTSVIGRFEDQGCIRVESQTKNVHSQLTIPFENISSIKVIPSLQVNSQQLLKIVAVEKTD